MPITSAFWLDCGHESGRSGSNYGDQLTAFLLESLFGVQAVKTPLPNSALVCVGSILEAVPQDYTGSIIGTGFMDERSRGSFPKAQILALRGALTAERCDACVPLGDPGLLVRDLAHRSGDIGPVVIPHYIDQDLREQYPDYVYVDILDDPRLFIDQVVNASLVVTSSLHALITADAFGIPRVLVPHHRVGGGLFKFADYSTSIGAEITPRETYLADPNSVERCILRLRECFEEFACGLV